MYLYTFIYFLLWLVLSQVAKKSSCGIIIVHQIFAPVFPMSLWLFRSGEPRLNHSQQRMGQRSVIIIYASCETMTMTHRGRAECRTQGGAGHRGCPDLRTQLTTRQVQTPLAVHTRHFLNPHTLK